MTTFEWPAAFALLVPILLLPLQSRLTGRNRLHVPGPGTHRSGWTLRRLLWWLPSGLRMAGLAFVVVALARPKEVRRSTTIDSEGLDIMLAIDTSGSMRAEDLSSRGRGVTRLDVAKAVMAEFVDGRPFDRIGVVVFGAEAFTHVPLTLDHETLDRVLSSIQIGIAGEQRTAIGDAIAVSSKRLKDLEAPDRVLILLTDGQSNTGRLSPTEAAELAAPLGIRIYTIGVGGASRGLFSMSDGLDERTLEAVADATGGRYFRATNARSLEEIYTTIDELEPSPAEVTEWVDDIERYREWLTPGLLLLFLDLLLSATWLRRGP